MSDQDGTAFMWDTDTWITLDSYFAQDKILTRHQLDSFNEFVDFTIPQIIERNNPVVIATDYDEKIGDFKKKYIIEFMQTYLSKPLIQENNDVIKPLLPNEARLRGLTYAAPMFIDVKHSLILKDDTGEIKVLPDTPMSAVETKIPFFKLPVMTHSKFCHLNRANEQTLKEMGECPFDQGGYFVVNGGEKVLVSQERVADNTTYVWPPSKNPTTKYTHEAEIKSSIDQRFYPIKTNKVKLTKEPSEKAIREAAKKGLVAGRTFRVQMPYLKEDIPLFIMFKALGVTTEKEIYEIILSNLDTIGANYINLLLASAEEARSKGVVTQDSALHYLSRQLNLTLSKDFQEGDLNIKLKYVKNILNRELFPHIGHNNRKKAFQLGYMTRKLMDCFFGVRPYNDRDHYGGKRVDLAGPLLTKLFSPNFIKLIKDLRQQILPKLTGTMNSLYPSLRKIIQGCNIESKIKFGLSTGNWSTQKNVVSASKKGIAQVLNRLSFQGALSHTRRIQSPLERAGSKIVAPRKLHGTQHHMVCPNETPEGGQVGTMRNFAMQTHVTIQTSDYPIRIALTELGVKDLTEVRPAEVYYSTKILINGDYFGVIADTLVKALYDKLRILKRHGIIVPYISIAWMIDWKEIHIQTDGGRYIRPMYIVENNQSLIANAVANNAKFRHYFRSGSMKWMAFLSGLSAKEPVKGDQLTLANGGLIEYLDTNELETAMVATTPLDLDGNSKDNQIYVYFTHMEIHSMMMMGVASAVIPHSDHNQSPRNCYYSSMGKQAIGYYVTNYNSRMDTMAHVLFYGQRPLVTTHCMSYTFLDVLPHGVTSQLLYGCYTGYNQEDSVILNGDAVQRGFFNTIFFRTYTDKEQKHKSATTASERFTKPNKEETRDIKHDARSYHAINDDGIPQVGKEVRGGDVIIGKIVESKEKDKSGFLYKDVSTMVRHNEHGIIDMVIPDPNKKIHPYNAEGHRFIKVRVSTLRKPEIGDKFACYDDQTEVLTTRGWVLFRELMSEDQVATLNHHQELQYETPQAIYQYPFQGQMYQVKSDEMNVLVTPNHKLYVAFNPDASCKLVSALEIGCRDIWCSKTTINAQKDLRYCHLMSSSDDTDHPKIWIVNTFGWMIFYATYLCNGYLDQGSHAIHMRMNNSCIEQMLVLATKILDWAYQENGDNIRCDSPDETVWTFNHVGAYQHLDTLGRDHLDPIVWQLSQSQAHTLLQCLLVHGNTFPWCESKSMQNDLQRLCLHAGCSAVFSDDHQLTFSHAKQLHKVTAQQIEWVPYDGLVYCCQVSSGVIYVRREGRAVWCGNSRSGQKGVNGILYNTNDMPFTASGLLPDIILNPHAIPSRMTAGKLIETILGKVGVCTGQPQDATPFGPVNYEYMRNTLKAHGLDEFGNEVLYNGQTGHMFDAVFFYGPTYYQRLKHMVDDKIHSRESGPVQLATRQPAEGRSREGGLRLGEMERDVLIAHGMPKFLKERMMDASDLFRVYASKKEKSIIVANPDKRIYRFAGQDIKDDEVVEVQLPFAMKVLLQEIESMGTDVMLEFS